MAKTEHKFDKVRLNQPVVIGSGADITVESNGERRRLVTSPVMDYSLSFVDGITIETKNSVYAGMLENADTLGRTEYDFDRIRANKPVVIGERADITVTIGGVQRQMLTSIVDDCFLSTDGSIRIKTKNSAYTGELENPEIFSTVDTDFDRAVASIPQPENGLEQ